MHLEADRPEEHGWCEVKKRNAYIYRYSDRVAVYLGAGAETLYLKPEDAEKIAALLTLTARDAADVPFGKSELPTTEFEITA